MRKIYVLGSMALLLPFLAGCSTRHHVVPVNMTPQARVSPELINGFEKPQPKHGKVKLSKHLREEAEAARVAARNRAKLKALQKVVRRNQQVVGEVDQRLGEQAESIARGL